jgi:hypothetical protein
VELLTCFYTIIMLQTKDSRLLRRYAVSRTLIEGLGLPGGEDGGVHYFETPIIIHLSTRHNVP